MPEKKKVSFDAQGRIVVVSLNPRLYSQNIIMRAAYRFIDDFDVRVEGDPFSEFKVSFKAKTDEPVSREDLEALCDAFFTELVHVSVEEVQARRYADIRNALVGAALRNIVPQVDVEKLAEKMREKKGKKEAKSKEVCG